MAASVWIELCSCSSWVIRGYLFALEVELVDQVFVVLAELVLVDVHRFVALEGLLALDLGAVVRLLVVAVLQLHFDVVVVKRFRLFVTHDVGYRLSLRKLLPELSRLADCSHLHFVLYGLHLAELLLKLLQPICRADLNDFRRESVGGARLLLVVAVDDGLLFEELLDLLVRDCRVQAFELGYNSHTSTVQSLGISLFASTCWFALFMNAPKHEMIMKYIPK